MKIPQDSKLSMKSVVHKGLLRPKYFICLELENKTYKMQHCRYVWGIPFLLRLRLFIALWKLIKTNEKCSSFAYNQGL